jgi:hypothetical protein
MQQAQPIKVTLVVLVLVTPLVVVVVQVQREDQQPLVRLVVVAVQEFRQVLLVHR